MSIQIPYLPVTLSPNGIEITINNQHPFHPHLTSILQSLFLLEHENADLYLFGLCLLLLTYCFRKLHAFCRPPPVHKKILPRRPALQILFKPDDISTSMNPNSSPPTATAAGTAADGSGNGDNRNDWSNSKPMNWNSNLGSTRQSRRMKADVTSRHSTQPSNTYTKHRNKTEQELQVEVENEEFKEFISNQEITHQNDDDISSIDDHDEYMSTTTAYSTATGRTNTNSHNNTTNKKTTPFVTPHDLPDSFAPLLSSSQMEILTEELTADLLHGTHVEGSIRLRRGRHEIPLDKDPSRPQLVLDVPLSTGCKMTAVASIGSDGLSNDDDMDVTKPTNERSLPLVKHAGIMLDPPLPLVNVAPTLIHFPTLFEDNLVKYTLRRIQIIRYALDFINSMSSFIEKVLWIIESKCQIHLGKVSITPLYKGEREQKEQQDGNVSDPKIDYSFMEPQWRLSLAFSGHVLLFGWIPIPFVNVILPTWIIPQPHALLEKLLTNQPLASAKLRRERIAEKQITLAVVDIVEAWNFKLGAVATPPALSADLVLPGGISVAVETMHGTDVSGGRPRGGVEAVGLGNNTASDVNSIETMSACTMYTDTQQHRWFRNRRRMKKSSVLSQRSSKKKRGFDANDLVPWKLDVVANGRIDRDRISMSLTKCVASHDSSCVEDADNGISRKSKFSLSGHVVICKPEPELVIDKSPSRNSASNLSLSNEHKKLQSDDISVASILLFTEKKKNASSSSRINDLLQYDYEFDIGEDTSLDAISLSIGASHPMLKGGTIITTILERFYAYGTVGARPNSIVDMSEVSRKRNILGHLPAIGLNVGIQNFFIPDESFSFSDDGQTKCIPELSGGQLMVRMTGGYQPNSLGTLDSKWNMSSKTLPSTRNSSRENLRTDQNSMFVSEGIKVVVDFGIASIVLNNETNVSEFPELEIFDDQKLQSLLSGSIDGSIGFHLRPQNTNKASTNTVLKSNVFNPLERFEIDFSGSKVFLKIVESNATLGHRRIIIPSETTFGVSIVESVVDMSFEGSTQCEFHWDFQGSSPILQVTQNIGESPQFVCHEDRQQVPILIDSLRQGRLNLNVSSVGGLTITEAATSREHREGLYDWKFFNAIVSPDEHSFDHMIHVLHDKRTMFKILQVVKLINSDLEKFMNYVLRQVWRAKEIFDEEGVSDPGKAIPSYKMSRLMSLFLCDNDEQVEDILPIVSRAVAGEGIDVLGVKELLRKNVPFYDEWAPEIDRAVRWVEVMLGSQEAPKPFVENNVSPLCLTPKYQKQFSDIPSARELYAKLLEKRHLPLDFAFSGLVSRIAPYLSFRQIEYILETRSSTDWQTADIRRLRYVYSIKKKVLDISESYGGLSFMPQSFFVSVFLGEATRASLRARSDTNVGNIPFLSSPILNDGSSSFTTLQSLRQRRDIISKMPPSYVQPHNFISTATQKTAQTSTSSRLGASRYTSHRTRRFRGTLSDFEEAFSIGDSLLGPQDVAILLQAGLTSSMKGSTVVQLNQRMLLDLMNSQPRLFAVAVLAEIGSLGGEGNPRGLASALMALLDLDQSSFNEFHRLDMHQLLESWLPGLTMPRRNDYLAGGRWASQSYYSAMFGVSKNILEDAEAYIAFKHHVQRVRHNEECDPVPTAKESDMTLTKDQGDSHRKDFDLLPFQGSTKVDAAIDSTKRRIEEADEEGQKIFESLISRKVTSKECEACTKALQKYDEAFKSCANLLQLDKLSFHADWFKHFYRRNYDALMVKSVYDNIVNNDDDVREWLGKLRRFQSTIDEPNNSLSTSKSFTISTEEENLYFDDISQLHEQDIIDEIVDLIFFDEQERENIRSDPLTRLLISNPPGNYNFTIVSAMGVITEGKKGLELDTALRRLKQQRGVEVVRADTGTARSFEYNASKIEDAIEIAVQFDKPYGLLGYSQGCANGLFCESLLRSGTPAQQRRLTSQNSYLVCRQLLFSAANGSMHGPAIEAKIHRLIVMCEQFFKYQQGYFSRAFTKSVLEALTDIMDSAAFQKFVAGGGGTFLHGGSKAFWREAQHLPNVPTCVLRGVLEEHTTPESLQMISNFLSKHAGSPLHDSQVHVYDAVGQPIYTHNRNSKILKLCDMGGAIQRTHHWSPLADEVKFVQTQLDVERGTFLCAKDRHVFPWCDVNARFGFIEYESNEIETGSLEKPKYIRRSTDTSWEPIM